MADYSKLYNTYSRIIEKSGLKDASLYWNDPNTQEFQQKEGQKAEQEQPNQLAEAEKVKGEFAIQKTQMETQFKGQVAQMKQAADFEKEMMKTENEAQLQALKTQLDNRAKELDRESKEAIAIMQEEVKLIIAGMPKDIGEAGLASEINE